jgi:large subunit ribosomal protein L21
VQGDVGSEILLDKVLLYSDGDAVEVGQPYLGGRSIRTKIAKHGRGKKVLVFKYKRRKDYRRRQGHRTDFTELSVEEFLS